MSHTSEKLTPATYHVSRLVVPGTKRNNIDFHTVEQEAGRAVLKLLDAKIGKYSSLTKVKLN